MPTMPIKAMEAGAHVFIEKPLAATVEDAERVVATAKRLKRKLVIGYILRHHPSWMEFIRIARELGGPYVMRMNLNQQSHAEQWATHKRLMQSTSPIVDCGVHYVDVMCQICDAKPRQVRGMGVRLTNEIAPEHVQLRPPAGDVRGRLGRLVRSRLGPDDLRDRVLREGRDDAQGLRLHRHEGRRQVGGHGDPHQDLDHPHALGGAGPQRPVCAARPGTSMADEPGHQALCDREQAYVLKAIREDIDLTQHMADGVNSLKIVLAADRSVREGRAIDL